MKKCSYCGKEYPDDAVRCVNDDTPLAGRESQPSSGAQVVAALVAPPALVAGESVHPAQAAPWTDRQLLIMEVVLVCVIAVGSGVLTSFYSLFGNNSRTQGGADIKWIYGIVREGSVLGLLWYVLLRRGKTFRYLGLVWERMDIVRSIGLRLGASLGFYAVYYVIYHSGMTAVSRKAASDHVGSILFAGGVSFAAMLFQFLNPFFEELIVRAYLMTEIKHLTGSATKAIIASTVLQTSYHFYQGVPMALAEGAIFLIWSIYYSKTNRIAPIILAHLYSDVGGTLWYLFNQ